MSRCVTFVVSALSETTCEPLQPHSAGRSRKSKPAEAVDTVEQQPVQQQNKENVATEATQHNEAKSSKASSKGRKAGTTSGPTRAAEQALWAQGFKAVAGVDEAGRGPLAGPVVAAAAMLPPDAEFPGLNDSKQMTEEAREELYQQLTAHPEVTWAV